MTLKQTIGTMLIAAILSTAAMGADPAFDPAEVKDPVAVVAKARELRQLTDQGDADAAYRFALLVAYVMSGKGPGLDEAQAAEFRQLSERKYGSQWMMKAAELGSQPAIEAVCRIGNDPLAPARLRDQGKARCDEMRAKHPAQ